MAEAKNNFVKSKMNQDLEARLVPPGEYRNALNIAISKSEGDDVGELENIIGNTLLTDYGLSDDYKCIGYIIDGSRNGIYTFITNFTDNSPSGLDNKQNPIGTANSFVAYYNINTLTWELLVGGSFLNFNILHPITGVNLVEDLLFWTDNRNQPRKINVVTALSAPYTSPSPYYTHEDHISVAKYYPHNPISLLSYQAGADPFKSTMENVVDEYLPAHCAAKVKSVTAPIPYTAFVLHGPHPTNIKADPGGDGDLITGPNINGRPTVFTQVEVGGSPPTNANETHLTIDPSEPQQTLAPDDVVYFHRRNPFYNQNWPGDPDYLSDKFVRFSYRFKFNDGEYSLIAPFTQIAFVPKQDGYFIGYNAEENNPAVGQEAETYRSTVVDFMENKIQDIQLVIPHVTLQAYETVPWADLRDVLKVEEIEILYTESDSNAIKIIDTLYTDNLTTGFGDELSYSYQSQKPWKTLPTADTTRVYDKVPIRALAQETAGNRIIYGNFVDKHTSPEYLEYIVSIAEKPPIPTGGISNPEFSNKDYYVRKEYQNHTLKQNRTYQVGIVLSDRYGRQSDVTLTKPLPTDSGSTFYKDSTIYHPYRNVESRLISDGSVSPPATPNDTWPGDMLELLFTQVIPEVSTRPGYPGLYNAGIGELTGWYGYIPDPAILPGPDVTCTAWAIPVNPPALTDPAVVEFDIVAGVIVPSSIHVVYPGSGYKDGDKLQLVAQAPTPLCTPVGGYGDAYIFAEVAPPNHLGWYSYKVVVKQTEQEYYNVYLPGILAGYPYDESIDDADGDVALTLTFPTGEQNRTSHIALINDNINKIPRDLNEVGPVQREFRSSVRLFGRVENVKLTIPGDADESHTNKQYPVGSIGDIVSVIGTMTDLKLGDLSTTPWAPAITANDCELYNIYSPLNDPLIAKLSTEKEIGWPKTTMDPFLAVYETEPVLSKLDIFWETTTSGLVSELNDAILYDDPLIPTGISDPNLSINENDPPGLDIGGPFSVIGTNNQVLLGATVTLLMVKDGTNAFRSGIELYSPAPDLYQFKLSGVNGFFTCWQNPQRNALEIYLNISHTIPGEPPSSIDILVPCSVNNVAPVERNSGYNVADPDAWVNYTRDGIKLKTLGWCTGTINPCPAGGPGSYYNTVNGDIWMSNDMGPSTFYACSAGGKYYPTNEGCTDDWGIGACNWHDPHEQYIGVGSGPFLNAPSPTFGNTSAMYQNSYGQASKPGRYADIEWGWARWSNNWYSTAFNTQNISSPYGSRIVALAKYQLNILHTPWCGCVDESPSGCTTAPHPQDFVGPVNTNWDGQFKAANGAWGSAPGQFPVGPDTENEIVFDIVRMYRVSWMQGAQLECSTSYANGSAPCDCDHPLAYHRTSGGGKEIIFGDNSFPNGSGYPRWVNGCGPAFPPYPVYYYQNPDLVTDTGFGNSIGEAYCGERYNRPDPAGLGRQCYWKDIQYLKDNGYLYGVRGWAGAPFGQNPMVPNGPQNNPNETALGLAPGTLAQIPENDIPILLPQALYGVEMEHFVPGINANYDCFSHWNEHGCCDPVNAIYAPVAYPEEFYQHSYSGNYYMTSWALMIQHYGHFRSVTQAMGWIDQAATIHSDTFPASVGGVAVPQSRKYTPAGRYVVTLRATDRGGDGMFFEWDVPITILPHGGIQWQDAYQPLGGGYNYNCNPPSWSGC